MMDPYHSIARWSRSAVKTVRQFKQQVDPPTYVSRSAPLKAGMPRITRFLCILFICENKSTSRISYLKIDVDPRLKFTERTSKYLLKGPFTWGNS